MQKILEIVYNWGMKPYVLILANLFLALQGCRPTFESPPKAIIWDSEGQYQTLTDTYVPERVFFDGTRWFGVAQNRYDPMSSGYPKGFPVASLEGHHWVYMESEGFILVRGKDGFYRAFRKSEETGPGGGESVSREEIPFPGFQGEIASHNAGKTLIGLKNNTELWRWDYQGIGWFKWHELRAPVDFWMLARDRVLTVSGRVAEVFPLEIEGPLKAGTVPGNGPAILTQDGTHLLYWDRELKLFDLETFQSKPFRVE